MASVIEDAQRLAGSLHFWFRRQYGLAPTDPRYLEMTERDILIEYEAHMATEGEPLKTCFECGRQTHGKHCLACGVELTGDKKFDEVMKAVEEGKEVDIEAALRAPVEEDEFVPVERGGSS